MTGIYIHIPFCIKKCPYCDFYSFTAEESRKDSYLEAVLLCLKEWKSKIKDHIDTVYFGGGTPGIFGGERINKVLDCIRDNYNLTGDAEITVECNPSSVSEGLMKALAEGGVNRISMGMQSAVDGERKALGRLSDTNKVIKSIALAKEYGIDNISLDIMLGVPNQTLESLDKSIDFLLSQDINHISAYMLKIEEGTPFYKMRENLILPDEDETCDMYLHTVERLKEGGFCQYEISNFSKDGFESRHNLKYWHCEEYLGIGPSAHSFIDGSRFYYDRDFTRFLTDMKPTDDGEGGDEDEYIMLSLRLSEGLIFENYRKRYGKDIDEKIISKAKSLEKAGVLTLNETAIALTEKGFLLSNSIIAELLS